MPQNKKVNFFSNLNNIKDLKIYLHALKELVLSGKYILGRNVKSFEKNFKDFIGSKYCIGVGSGTDALIISLLSLNIKKNDEVITTSHTATATVSAIIAAGATPVFVDIDKETYNMSEESLKKMISNKTKAIILVHMYGLMANIHAINKIAKKNKINLIEDCAQSNGSKLKNIKAGKLSKISCFSFYPSKNLSTFGDAGAIITSDKKLANKCFKIRQYGWNDKRESVINGINSRMDELHASILNIKLKNLIKENNIRNKKANIYLKNLKNENVSLPIIKKNYYHSFHLFVIFVKKRDKLRKFLKLNNIDTLLHYAKPLHKHKNFNSFKKDSLINTEKIYKGILSLPLNLDITIKEQLRIIKLIKYFYKNNL